MPIVRVRMKEGRAGVEFTVNPGQIIEIDSDLARQWIANGWAESMNSYEPEPVPSAPKIETTSIEPPARKAVHPPPSLKKRKR